MTTPTHEHSTNARTTTLRCELVESPQLDAELLRARFECDRRSGLAERILAAARA